MVRLDKRIYIVYINAYTMRVFLKGCENLSPKDKALMIRLSEKERLLLQDAAKKAGFESIAAFVRSMADREHAEQNMGEQNVLLAEILDCVKQILNKMDK